MGERGTPPSGRLHRRHRGLRIGDERGASLVEFAIVLPVAVMLLLGIITGGNAYQQKLSLTNGAREGARFGATLPVTSFTSINAWLDDVADVAAKAVDDGLGPDVASRVVCVAYVYPVAGPSTPNDRTTRRKESSSGTVYANDPCFTDGRPSTERRVQVLLRREGTLNAAFFTVDLELTGRSVARFEDLFG